MIVLPNKDALNAEAKAGESMEMEKTSSLPPSGGYEETKVAAVSEAEGSSESGESGLSLVSRLVHILHLIHDCESVYAVQH